MMLSAEFMKERLTTNEHSHERAHGYQIINPLTLYFSEIWNPSFWLLQQKKHDNIKTKLAVRVSLWVSERKSTWQYNVKCIKDMYEMSDHERHLLYLSKIDTHHCRQSSFLCFSNPHSAAIKVSCWWICSGTTLTELFEVCCTRKSSAVRGVYEKTQRSVTKPDSTMRSHTLQCREVRELNHVQSYILKFLHVEFAKICICANLPFLWQILIYLTILQKYDFSNPQTTGVQHKSILCIILNYRFCGHHNISVYSEEVLKQESFHCMTW